jgi:soluble lytic murein transglycosylase-like protein
MIIDAANKYGLNHAEMLRIAKCESTLNPNAVNYNYYENGNPSGVYQHISGYYPARAARYGYSEDVFDAYSNINVTAAMFADGQSRLWQCK